MAGAPQFDPDSFMKGKPVAFDPDAFMAKGKDDKPLADQPASVSGIAQTMGDQAKRFIGAAWENLNPSGLLHPIDTAHAAFNATTDAVDRTRKALNSGDHAGAVKAMVGAIPLVGPAGEQIVKDINDGKYAEAMGHAAGLRLALEAPKAAGKLAGTVSTVAKVATDPAVVREGIKILPKGAQAIKFYDTVKDAADRISTADPELDKIAQRVGAKSYAEADAPTREVIDAIKKNAKPEVPVPPAGRVHVDVGASPEAMPATPQAPGSIDNLLEGLRQKLVESGAIPKDYRLGQLEEPATSEAGSKAAVTPEIKSELDARPTVHKSAAETERQTTPEPGASAPKSAFTNESISVQNRMKALKIADELRRLQSAQPAPTTAQRIGNQLLSQ
jgi:hypothetical protein